MLKLLKSGQCLCLGLGLAACSGNQDGSAVKSVNENDIAVIVDEKPVVETDKERVVIFIEAENTLSDGGDTFVSEYVDLFKNHTGLNQSVYLLSDADQGSRWFLEYELAAKKIHPKAEGFQVAYAKRLATIANIQAMVAEIVHKYKDRQIAAKPKRLEVFLHFLAHGLTARGGGEGFVGANYDKYAWSDIAKDVFQPLADISDEFIAVVEPCFGGNLARHLKPLFFKKHNAMIVFGAPPWASQWAPTKEGVPILYPRSIEELIAALFHRTSIATMAIKGALQGYASEGLVGEADGEKDGDANVLVNGKEVKILDGEENLKEKHVVRTDEFMKYVQNKGNHMYCQYASAIRFTQIQEICASRGLKEVHLGDFISVDGFDPDVRARLPALLKLEKDAFIKRLNEDLTPLPMLHIMSTSKKDASLNPAAKSPLENGILSVADLNLSDLATDTPNLDSARRFYAMNKRGAAGLAEEGVACVRDYNQMTGDMYDVLKALLTADEESANNLKNQSKIAMDNDGDSDNDDDDGNDDEDSEDEDEKAIHPLCKIYQ